MKILVCVIMARTFDPEIHKKIIDWLETHKSFTYMSEIYRPLKINRDTMSRHIKYEKMKGNITESKGEFFWGSEERLRKELLKVYTDLNNLEEALDDPEVFKAHLNYYLKKGAKNAYIREIGKIRISLPGLQETS